MPVFNPLCVAVDSDAPRSNMQMAGAAERPIRYAGNEARHSNLLPLITCEGFGGREHDLVCCANAGARKVICLKAERKKKKR